MNKLGIGDWGLGIGVLGVGVWAQPPTPQSPIPNPQKVFLLFLTNNFIFIN